MLVTLVRHADAGERDASQWPDDDKRPLSPKGRKKQAACTRGMMVMDWSFTAIVTSPLLRARQTAAIIAEEMGFDGEVAESNVLGHECTPAAVCALLARYHANSRVCLVGHEPAFSQVAAALIGHSGDAQLELKKSGVIGIGFVSKPDPGMGRLLYHVKPGMLKALGNGA